MYKLNRLEIFSELTKFNHIKVTCDQVVCIDRPFYHINIPLDEGIKSIELFDDNNVLLASTNADYPQELIDNP
tara:strand:- start:83886 stop:84104 length:219 start_codon:yes stop_codon:yes gene_type:complete